MTQDVLDLALTSVFELNSNTFNLRVGFLDVFKIIADERDQTKFFMQAGKDIYSISAA